MHSRDVASTDRKARASQIIKEPTYSYFPFTSLRPRITDTTIAFQSLTSQSSAPHKIVTLDLRSSGQNQLRNHPAPSHKHPKIYKGPTMTSNRDPESLNDKIWFRLDFLNRRGVVVVGFAMFRCRCFARSIPVFGVDCGVDDDILHV